jgi:hypothetical protein
VDRLRPGAPRPWSCERCARCRRCTPRRSARPAVAVAAGSQDEALQVCYGDGGRHDRHGKCLNTAAVSVIHRHPVRRQLWRRRRDECKRWELGTLMGLSLIKTLGRLRIRLWSGRKRAGNPTEHPTRRRGSPPSINNALGLSYKAQIKLLIFENVKNPSPW